MASTTSLLECLCWQTRKQRRASRTRPIPAEASFHPSPSFQQKGWGPADHTVQARGIRERWRRKEVYNLSQSPCTELLGAYSRQLEFRAALRAPLQRIVASCFVSICFQSQVLGLAGDNLEFLTLLAAETTDTQVCSLLSAGGGTQGIIQSPNSWAGSSVPPRAWHTDCAAPIQQDEPRGGMGTIRSHIHMTPSKPKTAFLIPSASLRHRHFQGCKRQLTGRLRSQYPLVPFCPVASEVSV